MVIREMDMKHSHPPHLPPESCRVDTHYRLRSLRWTVFLIVISFLSGTAAALSVSAWITPAQVASIGYRQNAVGNGKDSLFQSTDPEFVRQTEQKIVAVFDRRKKTNKIFYSEKAGVGSAAVLSSDGWVAIYYPAYATGDEKNLEAVDDQGLYYSFEKAVYDKVGEVLYLKMKGEGFRIISFAEWRNLTAGQTLWAAWRGEWQAVMLDGLVKIDEKGVLPIWRPAYLYSLTPIAPDGALLFNGSGELVGVAKGGKVTPAWLISSQVSSLLDKKAVKYNLVNWRGWIVNGVELDGKWQKLNGFYVSEASGAGGKGSVMAGDVVVKIAGESVSEYTLAEKIFSLSNEFTVTVWRAGTEVEVEVKKEMVKP